MYTKTYDVLDECTVKMTPELAKLCRTHKENRDPVGISYCADEKDISQVSEMLLSSGKYILKGNEEDFICISRFQYEEILKILSKEK